MSAAELVHLVNLYSFPNNYGNYGGMQEYYPLQNYLQSQSSLPLNNFLNRNQNLIENYSRQLNSTEERKELNSDYYIIPKNPGPKRSKLISFVISEFLFGFLGLYLSGAVQNSDWNWERWNSANGSFYPAAARGGLDGVTTSYAIFLSSEVITLEGTLLVATFGAYLGGAAANREWDWANWDWNAPATYDGAFKGVQDCVWLVEDLYEVYYFTAKAQLSNEGTAVFFAVTYAVGLALAYAYVALENQENHFWDYKSPVFIYGIVRGFHVGTRFPVGVGEIALEAIDSLEKAYQTKTDLYHPLKLSEGSQRFVNFLDNFIIRRKWLWGGAIWFGLIYVWEESSAFDVQHNQEEWANKFIYFESFLNGVMIGKDFEEYGIEIHRYLVT